MKDYFVYVGWSLIRGEENCVTIGITSNHWRREYNKVMNINVALPCKSLRHARAVERSGHEIFDRRYSRAFVVWNPIELSKSPNLTWDWWITDHRVTVAQTTDIVERMRNVQVTWKPENAHLYMAKARKHFQQKGVKYGK